MLDCSSCDEESIKNSVEKSGTDSVHDKAAEVVKKDELNVVHLADDANADVSSSPPSSPEPIQDDEEAVATSDSETQSQITWEKPSWTKTQLRQTISGEFVKRGACLQSPITHIRASIQATNLSVGGGGGGGGRSGNTADAENIAGFPDLSAPVLWRSKSESLEWQKPDWVAEKTKILRETEKGKVVKTKGDLQKPITMVEKNQMDSINLEANPMVLRPTEKGDVVKSKGDLQKPITHVEKNPMADVNFEANPDLVLQSTKLGEATKQGSSLAKPVTQINRQKDEARDVNLVANPAVLRKTELGEIVKKVGDLQAPITHVERGEVKDLNLEANPMMLKPTDKGFKIRLGDDLGGPIADIAKNKNPMADINFEANPDLVLQQTEQGHSVKYGASLAKAITHVNIEKDAARDVNFVANPALLRKTKLGDIVKTKGDLQKPITHVEREDLDYINFEANPMMLRPTSKGCLLRIGGDIARPITHISRNFMAEIDDFQADLKASGLIDDYTPADDSEDDTEHS